MRLEPLVRARWRLVSLILRKVLCELPLYGSRVIHAQRNPHVLSIEVFLVLAERGRCGQTWTNVVVQAVMSQSWCVLARPSVAASTNPPTGFGLGSCESSSSNVRRRREFSRGDTRNRGRPSPAFGLNARWRIAQLSKAQGDHRVAQGLAGQGSGRRQPKWLPTVDRPRATVKSLGLRVRGSFCVLPSEIGPLDRGRGNYAGLTAGHKANDLRANDPIAT